MDVAVCKQCGYELTGLADRGKCPECGHAYCISRRQGIVLPDTPEERGSRLLGRFKMIGLAAVGAVFILIGFCVTVLGGNKYAIWTGGFVGAMFLLFAVASYVDEKRQI